ncbi:LuxR C-terminal-related transcriptional regulator [Kitasatospora sp. NPDC089509]|uniref:LuxR C-terminal-related transcriptional regulator n=1 Tax=Kitasatospora sp. NPDC089509 TaxID=3364079 RepID=UPI0038306066
MFRILIASDEGLVRLGLRLIIEGEGGVEVVADCHFAEIGTVAMRERPDLIILDLGQRATGLPATVAEWTTSPQGPGIVVLAPRESHELLYGAYGHKVAGYLTRDTPGRLLIDAIRVAAAGGKVFFPGVEQMVSREERAAAVVKFPRQLNGREQELLLCLGRGMTNADIAIHLHLSPATVKNYVSDLLAKLEVKNRTQAAVLAEQYGVVVTASR